MTTHCMFRPETARKRPTARLQQVVRLTRGLSSSTGVLGLVCRPTHSKLCPTPLGKSHSCCAVYNCVLLILNAFQRSERDTKSCDPVLSIVPRAPLPEQVFTTRPENTPDATATFKCFGAIQAAPSDWSFEICDTMLSKVNLGAESSRLRTLQNSRCQNTQSCTGTEHHHVLHR